MKKTGIVAKIDGKFALINVNRPKECGDKCESGCTSCESKSMLVRVKNGLDAHVGDNVTLTLEDRDFVFSTFKLYTLPLLVFIVGVFIGYSYYEALSLPSADFGAIIIGFCFMVLTFIAVARWVKYTDKKRGSVLKMTSVIRRDNMITI